MTPLLKPSPPNAPSRPLPPSMALESSTTTVTMGDSPTMPSNRHATTPASDNWTLKKRSEVPEDIQIVPSAWSMQRKPDFTTNKIKLHKARLNLHGGKQIYGMNYFETYAPVVTWFAIRLMIIFGIILCWALRQVDFVMAYPQAPIKMDIYMELPQGIQTAHGNSKDHVLKLEKNIYGQKQAGRVWNSFLVDKLMSLGWVHSLIDNCVFFRDDIIFMVYVDDGIFLGNDDSKLQDAIKEVQDSGLNIDRGSGTKNVIFSNGPNFISECSNLL
jgi:hypothetical protein